MIRIKSNLIKSTLASNLVLALMTSNVAIAQETPTKVEGGYREVLVSAGYMTAIGAGIGAAMLAFKDEPHKNLRFITIGAASGFFVGTAFGAYTVLSPSFTLKKEDSDASSDFYRSSSQRATTQTSTKMAHDVNLQPVFDIDSGRLTAMNVHLKLADF